MADSVKIEILDREYLVACPEDERAALQQAAEYLSERLREVKSSGRIVGMERIAIMVALNITHELLQLRDEAGATATLNARLTALDNEVAAFLETHEREAHLPADRVRSD